MNYCQLKNVCKRYPHMNVIVQKGYGHCAYMAEHYREYGALLEQYMNIDEMHGGAVAEKLVRQGI